jgi:hypothetical protein
MIATLRYKQAECFYFAVVTAGTVGFGDHLDDTEHHPLIFPEVQMTVITLYMWGSLLVVQSCLAIMTTRTLKLVSSEMNRLIL